MTTHLGAHSYFSLLEGLNSPVELVEMAAHQGMPALALTDHLMLSGAVEFYLACIKNGIQPLLGLEVDLAWKEPGQRLTLLAGGEEGWPNLCRISSAANLLADEQQGVSLDVLNQYAKDLVLLSDDQGDPSGKRLSRLAEIFDHRTYVAMAGPYYRLAELAEDLELPAAAAPPVYYLQAQQGSLQKTLSAIRLNCQAASLPANAAAPSGAYFLSASELSARFKEYPEALDSVEEIIQRCRVELPVGKAHIPRVPLPRGVSEQAALRQKAEEGAKRIYGKITPEIRARLDHELEVIANLRFEPIFLIVEDIINFARNSGIPTASRGSAASSLVAHCLGITTPDPLALDLYFERFLNPARTTPPDIDTDIDSRGRDQVIEHVFKAFGEHQVSMVGTINHFRPRSALADAAKANGLAPERVRELVNQLPYRFWNRGGSEDEEAQAKVRSPFEALRGKNPQHAAIFQDAEALLKLPRHLSVHAGGLVVTPGPVTDRVPVMRSGSKGVMITQMDLLSIEALGLVKIDLLGIRGLTVLGDVANAIYSWRRKEYAGALEVLDDIPQEDAKTADLVEHGRTIGCFQIESPGMRGVLKEIHARKPEDIMVALALYRPGPLQGGLKDAFVRRFKGQEAITHLHPALEPLLEVTYGVILYQEQVLQIANRLAGFSLADADMLRRAMSHFDPGKQMIQLKKKFVEGAQRISDVQPEVGERVWELMAAFAGYGFPKAHAASYAQVGWRSAWCKTHFPAEFMAGVLANWGGYYPQRVYLSEARRMGLAIKPPHINHSLEQFAVSYPEGEAVLYMGLDQVRDLTRRTQEKIIQGRPFHSLEDFLARVDPRNQEAENLALVGALEGLGTRPVLLDRIRKGGWRAGQMSLFDWEGGRAEEWTLEQRMKAQKEVLGIYMDAHPLDLIPDKVARSRAVSTLDAAEKPGEKLRVAGVRLVSHRSWTEKGDPMLLLTLEDPEGVLDVIIPTDLFRRVRGFVQTDQPLLVTGVVEMDVESGDPVMRAERIERL